MDMKKIFGFLFNILKNLKQNEKREMINDKQVHNRHIWRISSK